MHHPKCLTQTHFSLPEGKLSISDAPFPIFLSSPKATEKASLPFSRQYYAMPINKTLSESQFNVPGFFVVIVFEVCGADIRGFAPFHVCS